MYLPQPPESSNVTSIDVQTFKVPLDQRSFGKEQTDLANGPDYDVDASVKPEGTTDCRGTVMLPSTFASRKLFW